MLEVNFYERVDDKRLKFAVIISKTDNKWIFCKHKERDTYEIPGGHREENEINKNDEETYGMLFSAEIFSFKEIDSEIEKIVITDELIENWTYPLIQPKLIKEAQKRGFC